MSWWEAKRLTLAIGGLVTGGIVFALVASLLFTGINRGAVAFWLLIVAVVLLVFAGGNRGLGSVHDGLNAYSLGWQHEVDIQRVHHMHEEGRGPRFSRSVVLALAAVPLLLLAFVVSAA